MKIRKKLGSSTTIAELVAKKLGVLKERRRELFNLGFIKVEEVERYVDVEELKKQIEEAGYGQGEIVIVRRPNHAG